MSDSRFEKKHTNKNSSASSLVEIRDSFNLSTTPTEHQHIKALKDKGYFNKIKCGDCVEKMKDIPNNSVDMVITSPPYDKVRKYNGFDYNLREAEE